MNKNLLIALLLITFIQILTYFQLQSQFAWDWAKRNYLLLAAAGFPLSLLLLVYLHYITLAFNGQTWPGRLIGFAVGAMVFAVCSRIVLNEPFDAKTIISLVLSLLILLVQIFWK